MNGVEDNLHLTLVSPQLKGPVLDCHTVVVESNRLRVVPMKSIQRRLLLTLHYNGQASPEVEPIFGVLIEPLRAEQNHSVDEGLSTKGPTVSEVRTLQIEVDIYLVAIELIQGPLGHLWKNSNRRGRVWHLTDAVKSHMVGRKHALIPLRQLEIEVSTLFFDIAQRAKANQQGLVGSPEAYEQVPPLVEETVTQTLGLPHCLHSSCGRSPKGSLEWEIRAHPWGSESGDLPPTSPHQGGGECSASKAEHGPQKSGSNSGRCGELRRNLPC